jgi:pSer/pThr/pTyr-binding forkhead associated (FHA) protein
VTDRCWQVEDLGSTNGTKVNGDRVVKCRLHSGDTLSFGTQRYVIIYSQNALWSAEPDAPAAIARRAASQNHERTEQLPKVARE